MRVASMQLLVATVLLMSANARAQCSKIDLTAKPAISLALSLGQDTVKVGSPLVLKVTMTNSSNHDISFWNSPRGSYKVEVRDSKDKLPSETQLGFARNGHAEINDVARTDPRLLNDSGACISLKPGERRVDNIDVSQRYEITSPDTYKIYVSREDPENTHLVKSNTVTLTVTP